MDEYTFSDHARDERQADSLSEDDIALVVGDYDEKIAREDGRVEYSRMLDDGRWMTAVVEGDGETVVTVWWDKRRSERRGRRRDRRGRWS
ncbi:MAG: DUF4258 domain-containing protein [Chloroflexota bacterium]|nr:DUF4258 domain-containing protein [Chloroflexota bacterium]